MRGRHGMSPNVTMLVIALMTTAASSVLVFLQPQSDCKVKCQNGGVCAYLREDPQVHQCMCFIDVYYGELCQYRYPETTTTELPTTQISHHNELHEGDGTEEHHHFAGHVDDKFDGSDHDYEHEDNPETPSYYDNHDQGEMSDDLVRHEEEATAAAAHPDAGQLKSDEVYHEAQMNKNKASRHVQEQSAANVYGETAPTNTEFNRLASYEQNNDDNYNYDDDDWMLVKRSATSGLAPLHSVYGVVAFAVFRLVC